MPQIQLSSSPRIFQWSCKNFSSAYSLFSLFALCRFFADWDFRGILRRPWMGRRWILKIGGEYTQTGSAGIPACNSKEKAITMRHGFPPSQETARKYCAKKIPFSIERGKKLPVWPKPGWCCRIRFASISGEISAIAYLPVFLAVGHDPWNA